MSKSVLKNLLLFVFSILFQEYSYSLGSSWGIDNNQSQISVVVIDPGHGGKDWGASVGNAIEKHIVLDIALKLGSLIETNYPEVKIVYTRSKDIFIPLYQRAEIANKNNADLFISIHVNAVKQKSVKGTETFVLGQHKNDDNLEAAKKENAVILLEDDYTSHYENFDPNSWESYIMFETVQSEYFLQSLDFAKEIQDQFRLNSMRRDRSVKQAGFIVLWQTSMPSVLVEAGFLSNSLERMYLQSESGKSDLATSIFKAFESYKQKIEAKSSFNLVTDEIKEESKKDTVKSKTEIKSYVTEDINPPEKTVKKTDTKKVPETIEKDSSVYLAIQLMALKRKLETTPEKFRGEEGVYMVEFNDYIRYYSGKFKSFSEAKRELRRIKPIFPQAFIVGFENNELISVKKALGKM